MNNRYYLRIKGSNEYYTGRVRNIYIARIYDEFAYNARTGGSCDPDSSIVLLKKLVPKRVL